MRCLNRKELGTIEKLMNSFLHSKQIQIPPKILSRLRRDSKTIRDLARKSTPLVKKKKLLNQYGGSILPVILGILAPPLIQGVIEPLIGKIFKKKKHG